MFFTEIYKIISRKITIIGMALVVFFIFCHFQMSIPDTYIGDGKCYVNAKAIQKNREITAPYEGQLTKEKVADIMKKYGLPPDNQEVDLHVNLQNETADKGYHSNFLNEFVSQHLVRYQYDGDVSQISFLSGEGMEEYFLPGLVFRYYGGWDWYWDTYFLIFFVVTILTIIALSPVFSEEYTLKTADVILTTKNGRQKLFVVKVGASLFFSTLVYVINMGFSFFLFLSSYGIKALQVSTIYTMNPNYYHYQPLWLTILTILVFGWLAHMALVLMILAISAKCKQTFQAVLYSMFAYLAPAAVFFLFLRHNMANRIIYYINLIIENTPFLFPGWSLYEDAQMRIIRVGVLAAFMAGMTLYGRKKYCSTVK